MQVHVHYSSQPGIVPPRIASDPYLGCRELLSAERQLISSVRGGLPRPRQLLSCARGGLLCARQLLALLLALLLEMRHLQGQLLALLLVVRRLLALLLQGACRLAQRRLLLDQLAGSALLGVL